MALFQWFGPVLILSTLVYSFFEDWGGGYSYGPRFLTALVPILCIYVAIFLSEFQAHFRAGRFDYIKTGVIVVLLIISIVIQFIGVFYFPYLSDTQFPEPWDASRPIIINSLNDGITQIDTFAIQSIPPLPPFFYYSKSDYQSIMYAVNAREAGDYTTAVYYYKKSIQTNPNSYGVWNDLGNCQMILGQFDDALQSYDRALAIDPTNEIVSSNRARALQSIQAYNESQEANVSPPP
jgi:tetratricopeptide (TPR) repeat protein